jgi:hypothetical protein
MASEGVYNPVWGDFVTNRKNISTADAKNFVAFDKKPKNLTAGDYLDKGWDVLTNPLDYASYFLRPKNTVSTPWNMHEYEKKLEKFGVEDPITSHPVSEGIDFMSWFHPAGAAAQAFKMIPDTAESIGTAIENPTLSNIGSAAFETGMNTLALVPGSKYLKNAGKFLTEERPLKNLYDKVATGNSSLPIAWKVEKPLLTPKSSEYIARAYTAREAELLSKYGKGMNLTPEEWKEMETLVKSGATDFSKGNIPISRIPLYYSRSEQAIKEAKQINKLKLWQKFNTPSDKNIRTWSAGIPEGYSPERLARAQPIEKMRLVIPSKYTKNLGSEFAGMPYYDKRVPFIWNPETGRINSVAVGEKELMGNIPEGFQVIGRSNEGGMENIIIKPIKGSKQLPGSLSSGQANKTIYPSGIVETPINKIKAETPKASWTMEDIPGLHLKSTMSDGAVSKIIEPKTGLINVEQTLGIIGKESRGADKVAFVRQALGDNIPTKMDYNKFRKIVQEKIIKLKRQLVNHSSDYGLPSIGYPVPKRINFEKAIEFGEKEVKNFTKRFEEYKLYSENPELYRQSLPPEKQALFTDEQLKEIAKGMRDDYESRLIAAKDQLNKNLTEINDTPLENQTLVLGNEEEFGKGSSAHQNPEETLGHIHFLVDNETPDILTVTQMQSDAFQGTHRIMPDSKETLEYSIANMENHLINLQDNYDNAIMIDEYTYELPNGQRIDRDVYSKMVDDQYKIIENAKNELKMYDQKSLLDKNHQERFLQEFVAYAAERGDMNKIRVPTSKTSSKIQGYQEYTIGPETLEQAKTMPLEDFVELKKELKYKDTGVKPKESDIEFIKKMHKDINNKGVTTYYEPEYQTILKKYDEQPKLIKKLFGEEPKIVTDSKGNTWYEFDIPKKYKQGKGEIKAFNKNVNLHINGSMEATNDPQNEQYENVRNLLTSILDQIAIEFSGADKAIVEAIKRDINAKTKAEIIRDFEGALAALTPVQPTDPDLRDSDPNYQSRINEHNRNTQIFQQIKPTL